MGLLLQIGLELLGEALAALVDGTDLMLVAVVFLICGAVTAPSKKTRRFATVAAVRAA